MADQKPKPFGSRYVFTIQTRLDSTPVGDVPGGFRMDVVYQEGGRVWTDSEKYFQGWIEKNSELKSWWEAIEGLKIEGLPSFDAIVKDSRNAYDKIATVRKLGKLDPYASEVRKCSTRLPLEWFGMEGEVLSGGDWVIVRDDGVVHFDGRMTIRSSDEDRSLIDAKLSAVVDLRDRSKDSISDGGTIYRKWRSGSMPPRPVPVVFAATFESTQQTPPSWAPKRYARQAADYWKYTRLGRGQFVAVGEVPLDNKLLDPWELDVYEVYA